MASARRGGARDEMSLTRRSSLSSCVSNVPGGGGLGLGGGGGGGSVMSGDGASVFLRSASLPKRKAIMTCTGLGL